MKKFSHSLPLRGIIPPLVTPLTSSGDLDAAGLERLLAHLIDGGVVGLFILGSTGEGMSLSDEIKKEMIQRTAALVRGRIPLLVGVSHSALAESVKLTWVASEAGADAVVTTPPHFMIPTQSELCDYLDRLTAGLPLPLFLYNIPALTTVTWELATVRSAMKNPGIIGIKDSSADMDYFRQLCVMGAERPDWSVLIGSEALLVSGIQAGGHGCVCGGANIFPRLFVTLAASALNGNLHLISALNAVALRISDAIAMRDRGMGDIIRGIKGALAHLKLCQEHPAPPLRGLTDFERQELRRQFLEISKDVASVLQGHFPATASLKSHSHASVADRKFSRS
ncbi:MAG: dihydrodipicolinate synthase family protein [Pirellulales bacterium]|nr:dihydrodipicolinate synthase family protein [Pirellulales bacterium]